MRKIMSLVLLLCVGIASAAFPIKLDVGANNLPAQVEPGWAQFLTADNGSTLYDGVKFTLAGVSGYRYRSSVDLNGVPNEMLWRDLCYGSGSVTVTIEGLRPNMIYEISVGAFDIESKLSTPHTADWQVGGVTILTTSFGIPGIPLGTLVPSADRNYLFSGFATSDATGKIIMQSVRGTGDGGGNYSFINGLVIDPFMWASNPTPADGAVDQLLNTTLSWETGKDPNNPTLPNPLIRAHYVYLTDTEPNFVGVTPVTVMAGSPTAATGSYGPLSLDMDKTYYWRVDEAVDNGMGGYTAPGDADTIDGKVWSFSTIKSFATIDPQPANTKVDLGGTAQFDIGYSSFSPAMVAWYKDGVLLVAGGDITITTTAATSTLSIANVDLTDEGAYTCQVTNDAGPVSSSAAVLAVKKLLAQYKFEQNGDDSVGAADGTAINNVAYAAGIVTAGGQAYAADPNGGNYFEVPGAAAYPRAGIGNGLDEFTYALWAKPALLGPGTIIGSFNTVDTTGIQFNIYSDGSVECYVREVGNVARSTRTAAGLLTADQWHHVACSYNGSVVKIYIDGRQRQSSSAAGPITGFTAWEYPVTLLARQNRTAADYKYKGQADDLRIYNHALTAEAIGYLYYDVTGVRPCVYGEPAFDFTLDCVVNISDFAEFAAHWLESGLLLVPYRNVVRTFSSRAGENAPGFLFVKRNDYAKEGKINARENIGIIACYYQFSSTK